METDSIIAYQIVESGMAKNWDYIYFARRIKDLRSSSIRISHIFREQNMVADTLAKEAYGQQNRREFFTLQDLPRNVQKLLYLDRIGLPNFRRKSL